MRTDQLIDALAADSRRRLPPGRALALAMFAGGGVALGLFLATMGPRGDIAAALATWRFDVKIMVIGLALAAAVAGAVRALRPTADGPGAGWLAVPLAVLAIAVVAEFALLAEGEWWQRLVGTNARACLVAIPSLSVAPLAAVLFAMRHGAPRSPAAAGAMAGCLAAGIGAALYGLHCFDDSPLFVGTWYTLAALPVIAAGALGGWLLLKW